MARHANAHPREAWWSNATAASRCASSGPWAAACGACPRAAWRPGESFADTALREVAEETGIEGVVERLLGAIDYSFYSRQDGSRIHKTVHYFLIRAVGGDTSHHDDEVSEARWMSLHDALSAMTYPNEREIVRRATEALQGPEPDQPT